MRLPLNCARRLVSSTKTDRQPEHQAADQGRMLLEQPEERGPWE